MISASALRRHAAGWIATAAAAAALAGCGGDDPPSLVGPSDDGDGPQHVHGLGVNPADGALFIATHTGLWRAAPDQERAIRVGDSRQDVMGFTVIGPNRFLGSGHPDVGQDLPPLLGLIESRDAKTWKPVSLLGEADFHVLRFSAGRVYGFDATNARLLTSTDGGRTWREQATPGPLIDLAIDPRDPDSVVAATEDALLHSTDGAKTWRPIARHVGLLAWPKADALYLVDGTGAVHRSTDAGRSFTTVGNAGGRPAAFSSDGDALLLALHDATVVRSEDGARTWTVRARP